MSISALQQSTQVQLETDSVDLRARARQLNAQPMAKLDTTETYRPETSSPAQPEAKGPVDLGAILNEVFQFIAGAFGGTQASTTSVGVQEKVEVAGQWSDGHVTAQGRAAAEVHARAQAVSETFVEEGGVGVRGGAEASVGASAEAAGSVCSDVGSIAGRARISAEAYARLYGEACAGPDGLRAAGRAEAGVLAVAEADAQAQLLGGLVEGKADARAEAGAGAQATARSAVTFAPPQAVVEGKAGAFAGARAGFSAKGGVAGVGYGIEAEVWSGAGAKAEFTGGLDDGKFKFRATLGVAVGVGACITINVEIDTKDLAAMVSGAVAAVGQLVGGLFGGLGDAVGGLFKGNGGQGAHAAALLDGLGGPAPGEGWGERRSAFTESGEAWSEELEGVVS